MAKKVVWHKGPPPSVGWWPASVYRMVGTLRFYDGETWSLAAFEGDNVDTIEHAAMTRAPNAAQSIIEWTDRPADWPERSRT